MASNILIAIKNLIKNPILNWYLIILEEIESMELGML